MQADMDDAPGYLGKTFKQKLTPWVLPVFLGTATCVGLLYGVAFFMPTSSRAVAPATPLAVSPWEQPPPGPKPDLPTVGLQPTRIKTQPLSQPRPTLKQADSVTAYIDRVPALGEGPKQSVFNDSNYVPRGAVNTISMGSDYTAPQSRRQDGLVFKGIKEQRRLKDFCPDPSSIAGRNCRQRWGLGVRNR